ncbi:tetratricopeptide repeat-containing diguanylate cyclase [Lysinibacillus sp. 54212]|uniref:tetratricopeptide repeat-containing diguanylate cyclase n=1 Tax=Lysinibacillus sp. 54212 TaxID=3119829 RepID=UPI002FCC8F8E
MQQTETIEFDSLQTLDEKFEYAKSMHLIANFEEGLSYFRILKTEYEQVKQYDKVIDCLGWICQNLANMGRVEELYKYLPEYKAYCNEYGTEVNRLKLNTYLAFISASIGAEESAIEYYNEAIFLAKKLNDTKRYLLSLINLQAVYLIMKNFDHANEIAYEVKRIFDRDPRVKTTMSEAAYYLNLITIKLEWNKLDEIEELLHSFEKINEIEKHSREVMYYRCVKGRYFNSLGHYEKAIEELEKAYDYVKKTEEEPFLTIILENLIKSNENVGDYKYALQYANLLNEKLSNQQKKQLRSETIKVIKEIDLDSMKQLVYVDGLTSIPNRRYLEKHGSKLVDDANRKGSNVYCGIIDIDHFKNINDRFGHIIGDLAIQQLAHVVKKALPEKVVFARYAGDEFVFLIEQVEEAEAFFQGLFNQMTNFEFRTEELEVNLTLSMGVASLYDCRDKELKVLLDLADQALYQSKNTGRNLISFYNNQESAFI